MSYSRVESGTFEGQYTTRNGITFEFKAFYRLLREQSRVDWSAVIVRADSNTRKSIGGNANHGSPEQTHDIAYKALVQEIDRVSQG
jgi:hypothetical protein